VVIGETAVIGNGVSILHEEPERKPRSLAWVTQTLRGRIARLAGSAPGKLTALSYELPDPAAWTLEHLCAAGAEADYPALVQLLASCETAAYHVSDAIGTRYFTLTSESLRSVGA
jgi:uncharacterized alpha-E superfamily protein